MYQHRLDELPSRKVYSHWLLLSLNAGFINAGGYLATGRFVTHVTGFATLFGVDLVDNRLDAAMGIMSVPFFFLLGAIIAGLLIERPIQQGKVPHYDYVMAGAACCLLISSLAGNFDQFGGGFGRSYHLKDTYILMALLCLASGLQNAAFTASSGKSVRTTHLTGLTTDIGLGIARIMARGMGKKKNKKEHLNESKINWLRVNSILAFVGGSALGAFLFKNSQFLGFIVPALISFYSAWEGRKLKNVSRRLALVVA